MKKKVLKEERIEEKSSQNILLMKAFAVQMSCEFKKFIQKQEDVVKQEQAQDEKWLDLGNIFLHFNDENDEECNRKKVEIVKRKPEKQESYVNMAMRLYPDESMVKALDFRKEICSEPFYQSGVFNCDILFTKRSDMWWRKKRRKCLRKMLIYFSKIFCLLFL